MVFLRDGQMYNLLGLCHESVAEQALGVDRPPPNPSFRKKPRPATQGQRSKDGGEGLGGPLCNLR